MTKKTNIILSILIVIFLPFLISLSAGLAYFVFLNSVGNYYFKENNYQMAGKYFRKAYDRWPDLYYTNIRLADLYFLQGQYESAEVFYEKTLSIKFNTKVNAFLCYSLFKSHDLNEGFNCSFQLINRAPGDKYANYMYGQALYLQNDYVNALQYFEYSFLLSQECDSKDFVISLCDELSYQDELKKYCQISKCTPKIDEPFAPDFNSIEICNMKGFYTHNGGN